MESTNDAGGPANQVELERFFERVVFELTAPLVDFVEWRLGIEHRDAEEIIQDVFVGWWDKLKTGSWDFSRSPRRWLHNRAFWTALNQRRRSRRHREVSLANRDQETEQDVVDENTEDPIATLERVERRKTLATALEKLRGFHRLVVELKIQNPDLEPTELAEIVSEKINELCKVERVRGALRYGIDQLKQICTRIHPSGL